MKEYLKKRGADLEKRITDLETTNRIANIEIESTTGIVQEGWRFGNTVRNKRIKELKLELKYS